MNNQNNKLDFLPLDGDDVMPLRKDPLIPGEHYHIYNRGINSEIVFRTNRNYFFFLRRINEILLPEVAHVIAYVLMPTHYHMLVELKNECFASAMGRIINSYTKAFNLDWCRTGPLFEGRFKSKHINTDEYVLELSRYIHLNPVSAHLVDTPDMWPYSSYLQITENKNQLVPVTDYLSRYFDNSDPKLGYQHFVEMGLKDKLEHSTNFDFN